MRTVLLIGPSIDRTKGGMATVIAEQIKFNSKNSGFVYKYIRSHVEGSLIEKIYVAIRSIIQVSFLSSSDLVHFHVASDASFYRKSLLMLIVKLKRKPTIMHIHGSDFDQFYFKSNIIAKIFVKYIFSTTDKVIVLSEYWNTFFKQSIPSASVQVIYNGVNVDTFLPNDTKIHHPNHFLFLGRLGKRKGIYDLIAALDIIVNTRKIKSIKIYIAGDGEIDEVSELINELGLQQHAILLGWLDDSKKLDHVKQVSTVVLPSYSEGLPMALIEAMAAGKVIISTRVGGIPELVEEGKNGFLVEPGDIEGLVEKIVYILQNKHLADTIAHNNISKVMSKYNLAENNRKLFELYTELVNK